MRIKKEFLRIGIDQLEKELGKEKARKIIEILERVAEIVIPRQEEEEKIKSKVDRIVSSIKEAARKRGISLDVILGGSFAKDTWLPGQSDVDLFIAFNKNHWDQDLSRLLKEILLDVSQSMKIKIEELKGSRNYYKIFYEDLEIEAVPVRNITHPGEAGNTTDLSKLHVEWLKRKTMENPWIPLHIRITKKFCRAARVYGAETYIKGFSGHVIDILVAYYGSFVSLLLAARKWGEREVIDPESLLNNPLKEMDKSKIISPLILVDPTTPSRNAAAALSKEKYEKFKQYVKEFLENPDISFFEEKPLRVEEFIKKNPARKYVVIRATPLDKKEDIAGAKMYKAYEFIASIIKKYGEILARDFYWKPEGKGLLIYALKDEIPREIEIKGPSRRRKRHVARFTQKHRNVYEKDGFICAREKLPWKDYDEYIMSHINLIKQWVKGLEIEII
ncbi:nucleotidyltransferase domain-containing protein [Candidatus Woesearchaeota archaeon]|nr:nucleotidyltransferase domain-containing protein [Candidatus Woesearchaeota archaeon]